MDLEPQERGAQVEDDSPVSHNEEDMSDVEGHSGGDQDDSCEDMRKHRMIAEHNDVLSKLKMQVRDINVREDFENQRNQRNFTMNNRQQESGIQFPVPFPFPHPATAFLPPMAPPPQPPSSGSSHSSEGSTSSQHNWSFEEQFKQVRQLYELSDDPKRKEFLDDLFSFMQKNGTPINRLPIMAKSVLDLYELYNLVIARGGLVDVINKKLWQEIIKGLHLPSSITSAAFTLRTQYMKYLYRYECERRNLSTELELQAAIDGNRREGRRSSYGQYDTLTRYGYESPNSTTHINPLTMVSAAQQQQLARMSSVMSGSMNLHNGTHHPAPPTNGVPLPNIPNLAPSEFEVRMMEYMTLLNKEMSMTAPRVSTAPAVRLERSPPNSASLLTPYDARARMNLMNMYNNNQTPIEHQNEPINLSETSPSIKREPDCREISPPPKRVSKEDDDEDKSLSPTLPAHPFSTHITINNRGSSTNGDGSLVVSMELNGITYQGVLFAQSSKSNSHSAIST